MLTLWVSVVASEMVLLTARAVPDSRARSGAHVRLQSRSFQSLVGPVRRRQVKSCSHNLAPTVLQQVARLLYYEDDDAVRRQYHDGRDDLAMAITLPKRWVAAPDHAQLVHKELQITHLYRKICYKVHV